MSSNYTLKARKMLNVSALDLLKGLKGPGHAVEFEDGTVLEMSAGDIVSSRYYWEFANRLGMKLVSNMNLLASYENGFYTAGTHSKYLGKVYKLYIKMLIHENRLTFENMEKAWKIQFEIMNNLFSELQYNIIEYGVSLTILDYIELQKDEELLKLIEESKNDKKNPKYVDLINKRVQALMLSKPRNNLSKLFNCGATNKTQTGHSIGTRGFVTDIGNMIYPEAVSTNLLKGFDDFYDMACESQVMAKALNLQEFGIKYSEWLQRELHLSSMSIGSVLLDDCGNRHYVDWYIRDANELALLEGTNILLDGEEVELDVSIHQELIGTIIKMRRINECNHLAGGHVCWKCLGAATYSMPQFANTAVTLITIAMAVIGQSMLSAKHYTDSATTKLIKLAPVAARYLKVKESNFYLKPVEETKAKYVILNHNSYYGYRLLSTNMSTKMDTLDTSKLSSVDKLYIGVEDNTGNVHRDYIDIKLDGRAGILDQKFIIHSLSNTILNDKGEYMIDITNYNGRLLYLENKEFSYDQFNTDFKKLLSSYSGLRKNSSPDKAIQEIFNYLNNKLTVNIKIVEVLVAGLTANNEAMNDYSVGNDIENRRVTSYKNIINNRGIGVSLGFEQQKKLLDNPEIYLNKRHIQYNPLEEVWNTKTIPK